MAFESLTDDQIADFINCAKDVIDPKVRSKNKDGHEQFSYRVEASDQYEHKIEIFKRQNLREGMEDDFSCGIYWIAPNGESLTLKRYNGPSHNHLNYLEKQKLGYTCHIHIATEKYIKANRKPEGFASITDKYSTLDGAFHCLIKECKVSGLTTKPDDINQTKLF